MIDQVHLKQLLHYDPDTGIWRWRVTRGGKAIAGSIAGSINHHGYRTIHMAGHQQQSARLAALYMTGKLPVDQVDHRDGNRANDRWDNIRLATMAENLRNRRTFSNNKSGLKGVFWCSQSNRWRAAIAVDGRGRHLGSFLLKEDAHATYQAAAVELHKDFANFGRGDK